MLFICYEADGEHLLEMYFPPLFIYQTHICPLVLYTSHFFWEAIRDLSGWVKSPLL